MKAILHYYDGTLKEIAVNERFKLGILNASMPKETDYTNIEFIDFGIDYVNPRAGEDGYLIIPSGRTGLGDDSLCYYRTRSDYEVVINGPHMIVYGAIYPGKSFMATVTGMSYDYDLVASVKNNTYSIYPRFLINGTTPYEEVEVRFETLPDGSDYNDVARAYRNYQVNRGEISPIREKIKKRPALAYAKDSLFVRIRQGWKPVPTPVLEQTLENEPPMKVACDFEDVEALIDEFKEQGIDQAEFCLVGWNIRGHDGRWPQIFPVEPELGGEEKLRHLIQKAKDMGYSIVCHTNSTDAYSIADLWNEDDIIRRKDGSLLQNQTSWSGGAMYDLCPKVAVKQAEELLPKVAELGFEGLHYIDVISTVPPRTCYSQLHPVTARECVNDWRRIMEQSQKLFGGFSSEGGFDFAVKNLDYGLYVSFGDKGCQLSDKNIPLWHLVYHGYVMSNPYSTTVNPDKEDLLKVIEYGCRPAIYFYSQFVTPSEERGNWMGTQDYACHTEEERKKSTSMIAKTYEAYRELSYLQSEFMESHKEVEPGVFCITYSDKSTVIVDYNKGSYTCIKAK